MEKEFIKQFVKSPLSVDCFILFQNSWVKFKIENAPLYTYLQLCVLHTVLKVWWATTVNSKWFAVKVGFYNLFLSVHFSAIAAEFLCNLHFGSYLNGLLYIWKAHWNRFSKKPDFFQRMHIYLPETSSIIYYKK